MSGPGRPDIYSHYIAASDNETPYSAHGLVRLAEAQGLFPDGLPLEELVRLRRNAVHAYIMRANRKLEGTPDAIDRHDPATPHDAFLGIRWKATIPERFLEPADRDLVLRFREDEAFRRNYIKQALDGPSQDDGPEPFLLAKNQPAPWRRFVLGLAMVIGILCFSLIIARKGPLDLISAMSADHNIEGLRQLLDDPDYATYRNTIILEIAGLNRLRQEPVAVFSDLDMVDAVFAFERNPMMLIEYYIIRPGHWMTLAGDHGYVSEINREGLVLITDDGSRFFAFPPCEVFGFYHMLQGNVQVFPRGENMFRVLNALTLVTPMEMDVTPVTGFLSGLYNCTDYRDFLQQVSADLALTLVEDEIVFQPKEGIRSHVGSYQVDAFAETTVAQVFQRYEHQLGANLVLQTNINLEVTFPPTQLDTFLNELGLNARLIGPNLIEIGEKGD